MKGGRVSLYGKRRKLGGELNALYAMERLKSGAGESEWRREDETYVKRWSRKDTSAVSQS
jgi:hypothetical protein